MCKKDDQTTNMLVKFRHKILIAEKTAKKMLGGYFFATPCITS